MAKGFPGASPRGLPAGQVQAKFQVAAALHQRGQLAQAQALYREILQVQPRHAASLHMLGVAALQTGRLELAVKWIDEAIALDPADAQAHNNRATALKDLKRLDEALAGYDRALALQPESAEVHSNRGNALLELGRPGEALASYDRALVLRPGHAKAHSNRGTALLRLQRPAEALASCDAALRLKPDFADAFHNRGAALKALGRPADALASCDQALALKPNHALAHGSRGTALLALKRLDEALASCDKALALKPDFAEAWVNRGNVQRERVDLTAARNDYAQALRIDPDDFLARWHAAFAVLPPLLRSEDEAAASRAALAQALDDLDAWFDPSRSHGAEKAVAASQPFQLAYQEEDNLDLLSRHGRLCHRLMADWQRTNAAEAAPPPPGAKIRIGLVSAHLHEHPVWRALVKGWLSNFDASRFEWHLFSLGEARDAETEVARAKASSFTERQPSLQAWTASILGKGCDVLIYPEIGMHQLTTQLASLRLAPLQVAAWGHPQTTGLPTMDHYLSGELLEPDDAQRHYTESLVTLPNLGCTFSAHQPAHRALDLAGLGLRDDRPILLCPGTLFKYMPAHDTVFPRIARRLGPCTFVFFDQQPRWTALLAARLRAAFEREGLSVDEHVRFIAWQSREGFYALMRRADVFLDTLGFSGFNTAMQAVECALPIAAMDGRFMRGRLASGILKRLGLEQLVAATPDGYCDIVERLVRDKAYRARMAAAIEERRSILYDDVAPLRALEQFLSAALGARA